MESVSSVLPALTGQTAGKLKQLKKAAGGAPGFVIYHTNYSLMAEPRLMLQEVTG